MTTKIFEVTVRGGADHNDEWLDELLIRAENIQEALAAAKKRLKEDGFDSDSRITAVMEA